MPPKHKGRAKADDSKPAAKKPRVDEEDIEEDDQVTVHVGGTEFRHSAKALCGWSKYFSRALQSGMRESDTKTFRFKDDDPKEWKVVTDIMDPLTFDAIIDGDNVHFVMVWMDRLDCAKGFKRCQGISKEIVKRICSCAVENDDLDKSGFSRLMLQMETCRFLMSEESQKSCRDFLELVITVFPHSLDDNMRGRIVNVMKVDDQLRNQLWNDLEKDCPVPFDGDSDHPMVKNGMLPSLILDSRYNKPKAKAFDKMVVALDRATSHPSVNPVPKIKHKIFSDEICQNLVPKSWKKQRGYKPFASMVNYDRAPLLEDWE